MSGRTMASPAEVGGGAGSSLATRLLVTQALLLAATAAACVAVAWFVAPVVFGDHLAADGVTGPPVERTHLEQAFVSSMLISLAISLLAAILMGLALTWSFSRRVQLSVAAAATAATDVAAGRLSVRLPRPGLGREFDQLAVAFNRLADRLEAVETTRRRMLADLAHEMRTPLATLDAHLEALEDRVRRFDAATLSVLQSSTQRLSRLARDIDSVSRAQEGNLPLDRRPVRPVHLLLAAADASQERLRAAGIDLAVEDFADRLVRVDTDRMGQVLGNLLDNALRHTPAGGRITLTARVSGSWVELEVQDSGEGIAPAHLAHLFDRFYRADTARNRAQGGTGIGLTIAKALVDIHGGSISAHSAGTDEGATFIVRLPVLPP